MTYLPNGTGNNFKNLKYLSIAEFLGLELLKRSNFKNMKYLMRINSVHNAIKSIEEDTFWDLPNLEVIILRYTYLEGLNERTFEKNIKLKEVWINQSEMQYLPENLFKNNLLLEVVSLVESGIHFIPTDFSELKNIRNFYIYNNGCFNGYYGKYTGNKIVQNYNNYTEFVNDIRGNCSNVPEKFLCGSNERTHIRCFL